MALFIAAGRYIMLGAYGDVSLFMEFVWLVIGIQGRQGSRCVFSVGIGREAWEGSESLLVGLVER